jgi:hypothetical protein
MDIKTVTKEPTFRDLLNILSEMPEEHLDDNLTVYDSESDEFIPIASIGTILNSDVIEDGCLVFSMATSI